MSIGITVNVENESLVNNSNLEFRKIPSLWLLYEINSNGTILRNVKSKKQIKIKLDYHHSEKGYYVAFVTCKKKVRRVQIAKVVAECWLGEKPDGYEIDHIDRNSHNNDYRNLRYVTKSEQMKNRDHSKISAIGKKNLERQQEALSKAVEITGRGETKWFRSMSQAAYYMAQIYGKTSEHIRAKLKKRRSRIYEYDINYLRNVETASSRSTEQGTVQSSME